MQEAEIVKSTLSPTIKFNICRALNFTIIVSYKACPILLCLNLRSVLDLLQPYHCKALAQNEAMSHTSHHPFRAWCGEKLGKINQIFGKKKTSSSKLPQKILKTGAKESIPFHCAASSAEAEAHPPILNEQPQAHAAKEHDNVLETGVANEVVEPMSNMLADETVLNASPSDGNNHSNSAAGNAELAQATGITRLSSEATFKSDTNISNFIEIESGMTNNDFWYSEKTPQWNHSVEIWRKQHPEDFKELRTMITSQGKTSTDGNAAFGAEDWLFNRPAQQTSKQTAARLKRWQPVMASVRGIAMTAAAADPHKIAPIVCASVFFGIDVSACFPVCSAELTRLDTIQLHESGGSR